jgi:hypothetical protein
VAIGKSVTISNGVSQQQWIATGFLLGEKVSALENQYVIFLVTCNHVVDDLKNPTTFLQLPSGNSTSITAMIRFNPQAGGAAHEYSLDMDKFVTNPATDVAVTPIDIQVLKHQGVSNISFFPNDVSVVNRMKASDLGLSEGDGIYLLGFPLGLVAEGKQNYVIVREGVIARIRDCLAEKRDSFLIDSFAFPGNSGGPVITKPEAFAISGTKTQNRSYLLGMVRAYEPYQDVAVSVQTKRPRIIFEENSGLTDVIPMDDVEDTIHVAMRQQASTSAVH